MHQNLTAALSAPKPLDPKAEACKKYARSFLAWMAANPSKWSDFLPEDYFPVYHDYGRVMSGGCLGFGKNIMKWPEDLIIGGVKRQDGLLAKAEALQSVFLVAGAGDVYNRIKVRASRKYSVAS